MKYITTDKIVAFLFHLAISSVVIGAVFILIFFFWYPSPYFEANGAWSVIRVLVLVDLVMGPLLTLVLFKKGKPGLILDLCIIAVIQLSALAYGINVIYGERPYYLVFAVDRFEVVGEVEVDKQKLKYQELKNKPNKGPILVFADFPKDKKERDDLLFEVLMEGKPDLERRAEYYHPYNSYKNRVLSKAKPLSNLFKNDESVKIRIEKFLKKNSGTKDDYLYLPMVGKNNDMALVINKDTGMPVDGIAGDPW